MSGGYWHKESFSTRVLGRSARVVSFLSVVFLAAVAAGTVGSWMQARKSDPLLDERVSALRKVLKANPDRIDLKDEIRLIDYRERRIYFSNLNHMRRGVSLMIFGAVVLLISAGISAEISRRLPSPADPERDRAWQSMNQAWRGVVVFAFALGVVGIFIGCRIDNKMIVKKKAPAPKPVAPAPVIEPSGTPPVGPQARRYVPPPKIGPAAARNWPGFMGPAGRGVATGRQAPSGWAYVGESNLLWSVFLDKYGYSSPAVWDENVFVSEADAEERSVICMDLNSGETKWSVTVGPYEDMPEDMEEMFDNAMYAAPTPVTDGERVYVIFGNGDIACLDFDGNEVWGRSLGVPVIDYGYSSSPVLCEGLLVVQLELEEGHYLAGLDASTGEEKWRSKRPDVSWATPLVYVDGNKTLLLCASMTSLSAHSAADGNQEWIIEDCFSGEIGSSVSVEGNIAYVTSLSEGVRAYRLGPRPELVWHWDEDPSEMASPLAYGGYVYIASKSGNIICLDGMTGEAQWTVETEREFYASPVCVDGIVYAINRDGLMVMLKAGSELEELGRMKSAEECDAVPAFVGSKVIIRAPDEVICYGK